jgi:hypothetical protein
MTCVLVVDANCICSIDQGPSAKPGSENVVLKKRGPVETAKHRLGLALGDGHSAGSLSEARRMSNREHVLARWPNAFGSRAGNAEAIAYAAAAIKGQPRTTVQWGPTFEEVRDEMCTGGFRLRPTPRREYKVLPPARQKRQRPDHHGRLPPRPNTHERLALPRAAMGIGLQLGAPLCCPYQLPVLGIDAHGSEGQELLPPEGSQWKFRPAKRAAFMA